MICAWRAVVLWDRDRRVVAILVLFILVTIGIFKWDPHRHFVLILDQNPQLPLVVTLVPVSDLTRIV